MVRDLQLESMLGGNRTCTLRALTSPASPLIDLAVRKVWRRKLPVLWVLTGPKAGDNAQILRAAEASGLRCEIKKIAIRPGFVTFKPRVQPSLQYVDLEQSDPLTGPWPDAVLTIGRHMSLVALWIREQSGGKTKLALFNAPKGDPNLFDLVVLPPYYRASGRPGEVRIRMPLIGIDPARIAEAGEKFHSALSALPRPLNVLLVGGDMGKRKLKPRFASDVMHRMQQGFAANGSIFVTTSRRTPPAVTAALAQALRPQDRLFSWGEAGAENPYLGLLAHGDTFTVTADSLSMIIEVARLGKPLIIAEPPGRPGLLGLLDRGRDMLRARDLHQAVAMLYASGHATQLGKPLRTPQDPLPDDTETVARKLRQLVTRTVE